MALISLSEAKEYLRVDSSDEDSLIENLLLSAEEIAKDVGRLSDETWESIDADSSESDTDDVVSLRASFRVAILYALAYYFEHREDAKHHDMILTLRSLLFSVREEVV